MEIKQHKLPIVVEHRVRIVEYKGVSYTRTRDISDVLGIKQPFEFTRGIRQAMGDETILQGDFAKELRDGTDNSRTPYIRVSHMIEYLEAGLMKHKTNGMKPTVLECLKQYMNTVKCN